jgi:hypothetical protein
MSHMFFDVGYKNHSVQALTTGTCNQVHTTLVKAIGLKELYTSIVSIFILQNHSIFSFIAKLYLFMTGLPGLDLLQKYLIISISRLDIS